MRVLDLFSGIGGFSLGLERTGGFETVAFCEIDKAAQQVLRKHWPHVPIYEDVSSLSAKDIDGPIDVICGGFPCQDISLAGRGAGLAGARSGLWFQFHRLISELRPQWVLIENVALLRSRGLDEVLRSLAQIGYDAEWNCISAANIGAPHLRERLWIVAYPNNDGQPVGPLHDEAPRLSPVVRDGGWPRWDGQPEDVRMADGLPGGMDRLKQLGNAVVPQIPELIGRAILARQSL